MRKSRNSNFVRLLALAINFQMIYSPMAYADLSSVVNSVSQIANTAASTVVQMNMQNNAQMQQQIQGLSSYTAQQIPPNKIAVPAFAACPVFMAKTNIPIKGQRCELESFDMNMLPYYSSLLDVATSNIETYSPYKITGNALDSPGMRCLEDAETKFNALLNSRVVEIDKLIEQLKTNLMLFEKNNENHLNAIKQGNALLFGKPQELLKDVRFEEKFSDEQCSTVLSGEQYKSSGQEGGYEKIKDTLGQLAFGGAGQQQTGESAKSFSAKSHNIEQDIIRLAGQAAERANKLDPQRLISGDPSQRLGTITGSLNNSLQNSKGLATAVTRAFSALDDRLHDVNSQVVSYLGDDAKKLIGRDLLNPRMSTASISEVYTKQAETQCINHFIARITNNGDVSSFQKSLKTRPDGYNISAQMQRDMDNSTINNLASELGNSNKTLKERISSFSSSGLKSTRFQVTQSTTIEGVTFSPGEHSLDNILNVAHKYCQNTYMKSRGEDGSEAPSVIKQNIEKAHSEFARAYTNFSTNLKSEIQNQLMNCSQDTSTGTAANSCSGDIYNTSGEGFCLRTARQCANNTLACADKAQKIYDTTRMEQKTLADSYNHKVESQKIGIMDQYLKIKTTLENKARELDLLFPGQVYAYQPKGTKNTEDLDLTVETFLLNDNESFEPSLKIQDPKAYYKKMEDNLLKIKENIEEQNKNIKEKLSAEKTNIANHAIKQIETWEGIETACNDRINQFNSTQTEMANKKNEDNKKLSDAQNKAFQACVDVSAMKRCPTSGEFSKLTEALDDVVVAGAYSNASTALKELNSSCEEFNNDSGNYHDATNENIPKWKGAEAFCKTQSYHSDCNSFTALNEQKKNYCNEENVILSETVITQKANELCLVNKCSTGEEKTTTRAMAITKIKEEAKQKCEKLTTDLIAAETKVQESFKSYAKSQYVSTFGQKRNISCGGTVAGDFGKTATDAINNITNAAAGTFTQPK